jgi:chromosome segregation ATPase
MTKQALQKELLEKVKPGTKPSQLKKSKSTGDLPATSPEPINQPRRKSIDLLSNPQSLKTQLQKAQDQISILELKLETCQRELDEKALVEKENTELKEKLTQTKTELDNSLTARHQSLKDFGQEHSKRKEVQKELNQTLKEASEELNQNEQTVTNLRTQLFKANQQINNLQKELAKNNNLSYNSDEFNSSLTYFKYGVYALLAISFIIFLKKTPQERNYD